MTMVAYLMVSAKATVLVLPPEVLIMLSALLVSRISRRKICKGYSRAQEDGCAHPIIPARHSVEQQYNGNRCLTQRDNNAE